MVEMRTLLLLAGVAVLSSRPPATVDVTVTEGTSMSVTASPDGRTLAIDLQGSIYTLSTSGGTATRITDLFNDARHPAWAPDGKWIAFQGYRDGAFHIWAIAPDGRNQHMLTTGTYDDREPAWSHDGTRVAFSSDRVPGSGPGTPGVVGNYNIWVLDTRTGELQQITRDPADDFMPTWSPNDDQIAFVSTRGGGQSVWSVTLAGGAEKQVSSAGTRADAPSWGANGKIVYHATGASSSHYEVDGAPITGDENVFPFRAAWLSPNEIVY